MIYKRAVRVSVHVSLMLAAAGCTASETGEPGAQHEEISAERLSVEDARASGEELKQLLLLSDRNEDGAITATEAREHAGASFAARSYMLDQVERTHIGVSLASEWTDGAVEELAAADRNGNGFLVPSEIEGASRNARAIFAFASGRTDLERSVTTDELTARVAALRATFDRVARDGVIMRSYVLEARLPASERDFFLDMFDPLVARPTLRATTFTHWVEAAQAELVATGKPTVSTTEALKASGTARRLWALTAGRTTRSAP